MASYQQPTIKPYCTQNGQKLLKVLAILSAKGLTHWPTKAPHIITLKQCQIKLCSNFGSMNPNLLTEINSVHVYANKFIPIITMHTVLLQYYIHL